MHTSNPGDSRKQAGASALPVRAPTLQFPVGFLTVQTIAGKKKKAFKTNRNPEIWGYFILRSFLIGFLCVCVCVLTGSWYWPLKRGQQLGYHY